MRRRQVLPPQPRLRLGGRRRPTAAHVVGPSDQELGEDPQHLPQVSFDEPVIGLGYSSGSWFGLGAAAGHRDLFSSFVDLDQPLNPADHLDPVRTTRLHAYFSAVVASTSEPDLADRLARVTLSTGQTYAEVTTHEQRLAEARDLRQHDPGIFREMVDGGIDSVVGGLELPALPGKFDRPVLFIYGEHASGSLVNEAGAAFNRDRYPWATEVRLPRRDHGLGLVEDPDPVVDAITTWYATLD